MPYCTCGAGVAAAERARRRVGRSSANLAPAVRDHSDLSVGDNAVVHRVEFDYALSPVYVSDTSLDAHARMNFFTQGSQPKHAQLEARVASSGICRQRGVSRRYVWIVRMYTNEEFESGPATNHLEGATNENGRLS